jgi:UDP-N-acetylmuramoyl-tripeptide--D-alanyl-D-alanine ligase
MDPLRISEITQAVEGKPVNCNGETLVKNMTTVIGNIRRGCLFIPLVGTAPVTKELVETAHEGGAAVVVIPNEVDSPVPQIIVKNTKIAYTNLYKYYRSKFKIPAIAVTGSAGKTSTKDMLALVLLQRSNVCKTIGNDNVIAGTLRTVLNMSNSHGAAVFEVGFEGYYGRLEKMADIARPTIGVITNISTGHLEYVGSKENVMKAKMEITKYFDSSSVLVINNDDECLSTIQDKPYRIIRVSTLGCGDYNAFSIVDSGEKGVEFKCNFKGEPHLFKLNVPGVHFVYSALICIAVGELLGLKIEQIKKGISDFKPYGLRMNVLRLKNNIKIINDSYNANLISMKSAVDTLKAFDGDRKIAVLGDVLEQGKNSEKIHRELGKHLADKCDVLIAVGKDSWYIFEEAKNFTEARYFKTRNEACLYLEGILKENDIILLKGSRGMRMEEIAYYLLRQFANNK